MEAGCDAVRECICVDALGACLVGRDLCQVQDVPDVERVSGDFDSREAVDREIAERMSLRRNRREERKREGCDEHESFHGVAPFRATGAQRIEKCGFSASARRYQVAASVRLPRQPAIQPRWKNFSASCVPSRSERLA